MSTERDERQRRAERAAAEGRLETAIAEYESLVAEQPRDLAAVNALGDLYVRAGRPGEALPFYMHVGDSYLREGFFSKAAGFYKKVIKLAPDAETPVLRLVDALEQQRLLVEARGQLLTLAQARARRGDSAGAQDLYARITLLEAAQVAAATAKPDAAQRDAAPALPSPGPPEAAMAAVAQGPETPEPAEAPTLEDVFERLREEARPPRGTEGRQQVAVGRTFLAAGMTEPALEAFGRACADADARAVAALALGETYEDLGDPASALEWYERAADAQESPEGERLAAMRRLAEFLEGAGEPVRALAVWLEVSTLCPDDREASDRVARLAAEEGR